MTFTIDLKHARPHFSAHDITWFTLQRCLTDTCFEWPDDNPLAEFSRHAYTLHVIDGSADYLADNWLQRRPALPLRGFN